jgi:hypothetical protein
MAEAATTPVAMVCGHCGSEDVLRDAYAEWDKGSQRWEIRTVFDQAVCETCGGETRIAEKPISRTVPAPQP